MGVCQFENFVKNMLTVKVIMLKIRQTFILDIKNRSIMLSAKIKAAIYLFNIFSWMYWSMSFNDK